MFCLNETFKKNILSNGSPAGEVTWHHVYGANNNAPDQRPDGNTLDTPFFFPAQSVRKFL